MARFRRLRAAASALRGGELETAAASLGVNPWWSWNWYQRGVGAPDATPPLEVAAVHACVATIAQEMARLPIRHYRRVEGGGRVELESSAPMRVLGRPNGYQSAPDFWLLLYLSLLTTGNAYAVAQRDGAGRVVSMHPQMPHTVQPRVVRETGEIFYSITPTDVAEAATPENTVPGRNVMHLRLFTPRHPLVGVSPLVALVYAIDRGETITRSSAAFFRNQARPSVILTTPEPLSPAKAQQIAKAWQDGMSGDHIGRTAVLDSGISPHTLSMTALDAALVEQYRLSVEDVARVYRLPLFMLGDLTKATFQNVESLQRTFVTQTLDFYVSNQAAALGLFFRLPPGETVEADVEGGMLRGELKERVEGLTRGIQGGLYTVNDARRRECLPPVEGGDKPLVQQQMVTLDQAVKPPAPPPVMLPPPTEDDIAAALRRELAHYV